MIDQKEDKARVRRQKTEQAIQLALQNQWEEALAANQAILELFPEDVDAHNRLGKALIELGRYGEAREAYAKALAIDRSNTIARKNLERLAAVVEKVATAPRPEGGRKVSPDLFIGEVGKSGTSSLIRPAPEVLTRAAVGDEVFLRPQDGSLVTENVKGEYLGEVEPRLGLRLRKLMEGGNQYTAAITSLSKGDVRVLIKETYQHPSQAGKPSFPPVGGKSFRPYIKESLLQYGISEEPELDEEEEMEEWRGDHQAKKVEGHIYRRQTPLTAEEEQDVAEAEEEDEEEP